MWSMVALDLHLTPQGGKKNIVLPPQLVRLNVADSCHNDNNALCNCCHEDISAITIDARPLCCSM